MKTFIVDRDKELTPGTREFARRRMLFALAKFDSKIDFATLVVSDINGPKGGIDKQCKVRIKLLREPELVITDQDGDLRTCVARVAERAGRTVSRVLSRNRDHGSRRRRDKNRSVVSEVAGDREDGQLV